MQHQVKIGGGKIAEVTFANDKPISLICGPCAIEGRDKTMRAAESIKTICEKLGIGVIFKSSFDKANRSSNTTGRGIGMDEGLNILAEIRSTFGMPVLTDIHESQQAEAVGQVVDVLQIPAFLCRQTDLLLAAAATGKAINVKKGQFLAPQDMANVVEKITATNNMNLMLCERGTTFGYGNLVSDMRGLRIMAETGFPVIFDATHSVQMPGGNGKSSGGKREFVEPLARAAIAVGVGGVFIEAHENPAEAISDGPNQVPMSHLEGLLTSLKRLDDVSKDLAYQAMPA
jgi:2-dehydro-3-deoxyphosphooctonate aldolase (KDO 8-P synthase)